MIPEDPFHEALCEPNCRAVNVTTDAVVKIPGPLSCGGVG